MKGVLLCLMLLVSGPAVAQGGLPAMLPLPGQVAAEFTAVGRVNAAGFRRQALCSGTLIRPDVVLTAAHCAGRPKDSGTTRVFVAGWARGDYVAARDIVRQIRHPAYRLTQMHDPRFDVGLLFLDTEVTEVAPLPLAPDAGADVAVMGYHRHIPHLLSGRTDCPVTRRDAYLLHIGCPVVSGNSGGPVLERDGAGGWQVVAVISSRYDSPTGPAAIAVRIPDWVRDTLEAHAKGALEDTVAN